MPDRKSLFSLLWFTATLVLLASVLVAPARTSGLFAASSRPDGLLHHFAIPPGQSTPLLSSAIATDPIPQVNALPSENEEQDRADAPDEPRVSFLIPCSFRKVPDRQSIDPRSILSHYPLRC